MNGPEHYAEAERLLEEARQVFDSIPKSPALVAAGELKAKVDEITMYGQLAEAHAVLARVALAVDVVWADSAADSLWAAAFQKGSAR